jgi:hypothetical protein
MLGPGKYDDLCSHVRQEAQAPCAIVIVLEGNKGTGFSVQADMVTLTMLPKILRDMAGTIERDLTKKNQA